VVGSASAFENSVGYAVASQFGPFVIPYFAARIQSELNRYHQIRELPLGGAVSEDTGKLYHPQPLPRMVIGSTLAAMVLLTVLLATAIAIPQFAAFHERAYNAAAQSDLRNARTWAEAYYADHSKYPETIYKAEKDFPAFQHSQGVDLVYERLTQDKYRITSTHKKGDREFKANSDEAGIYWREKKDRPGEWKVM